MELWGNGLINDRWGKDGLDWIVFLQVDFKRCKFFYKNTAGMKAQKPSRKRTGSRCFSVSSSLQRTLQRRNLRQHSETVETPESPMSSSNTKRAIWTHRQFSWDIHDFLRKKMRTWPDWDPWIWLMFLYVSNLDCSVWYRGTTSTNSVENQLH